MKHLALLLSSLVLLNGCASTPGGQVQQPTPEQIAAYGALIHNGIQDYKTIKQISK